MAIAAKQKSEKSPSVLPRELALAMFDQEARRVTGLSGEEFLARYDAGEFQDYEDTPEGRDLGYLILLIPFGRQVAA